MKILKFPKWNRIGYVEGSVKVNGKSTLRVRSIMFVRDPFLWFRTRKVVEIGDREILNLYNYSSASTREHDINIKNWLLGGEIEYVSENGTAQPAEIIKLVKK